MVAIAGFTTLPWTATAQGACTFSVSASPESVAEGETVTVTVRRGGAANPSSIDVETIDESAKAAADYEPISKQTLQFTTASSKTLSIPVKDDADSEPEESFRVHISNPRCGELTVFSIGPDAVVKIKASDVVSPATPAAQETGTSSSQGASPTSSPAKPPPTGSDSGDSPISSSPTARDSSADRALQADARDGGISMWAIIASVAVVLSVAVGIWYSRKSSA